MKKSTLKPKQKATISTNFDWEAEDEGKKETNILGFGDFSGGESVKVVVRIWPFSDLEKSRKDSSIVDTPDDRHVKLNFWQTNKMFKFNKSLDEGCLQDTVFEECGVHDLIMSSLDGYSSTIFAYG